MSLGAPAVAADALRDERDALYTKYAAELEQLAAWCDENELADQAETARHWLPELQQDKIYLYVIDDYGSASSTDPSGKSSSSSSRKQTNPPTAPSSEAIGQWHERFEKLRNRQAAELFALARRAADANQPSLAMQLLSETIRENPDHTDARRILGYANDGGTWCTPHARKMHARGFVWTDQFGWLRRADVDRYQRGERRDGRRWITRQEDARRHATIERGWRIETDHYAVTTNEDLGEGARLAERLERLRQIWRQLFAGYNLADGELAARFAGRRSAISPEQRHEVVYYRTRDEYNRALRPQQPKIDITLGIYLDQPRRAYFFAGDEQYDGTLYHEAAHQLFHESRRIAPDVGAKNNFWIIEGIAAYLESLVEQSLPAAANAERNNVVRLFTVGGDDAGRLPAARFRATEDDFYVPLAELCALGRDDVQNHPDIAKLYSQATGLATFLMHYAGGRYRSALERYLTAVYTGRADANTLAELTGRSYDQLDREYHDFLSAEPNTER